MEKKMKKRILITLVVLLFVFGFATNLQAIPVQWSVEDGGNGHWYEEIDTLMTWNDAEIYAESLDGYLATVTSQAENDFLWDTMIAPNISKFSILGGFPMLGGFQSPSTPEPDTGWQWVTGEEWKYTNWGIGQPDDAWGGQDYLSFWENNTWDDNYLNSLNFPSIVEIPEPATLLLLGLGGFVLRRKKYLSSVVRRSFSEGRRRME
jgi:hypothetical protein